MKEQTMTAEPDPRFRSSRSRQSLFNSRGQTVKQPRDIIQRLLSSPIL